MNIDTNKLPTFAQDYFKKVLKHAKFIFIVVITVLIGFLIFEINRLTTKEPSIEQITQQQQIIKRPKIDQETIDKIERLKDRNIAAQSLFEEARDNPFQD
ncbi:MAG TPA: hypothetical protein VFX86_02235 [Candidatus Saccharimonadales bacterium]|nr:hypothetical protein [Candidatus Saccharimonadales bacterium]